jgi:drug/metabolite transporter (DMT)-like permease
VLARAIVTLIVSYVMVARTEVSPWGNKKLGLVGRGILGFGGLTCYYASIAHLPLADATTIQQITPLVTALLAWWLLREPIGWSTALAVALGLAGVMLIVQPTGSDLDPIGLVFAFSAATCSAIAYVTVRQLAKTEHALVIVFYFPLVAMPLSVPWAVYDWVWPTPTGWLLLVAIGLTTQIGQVFLTLGLTVERAGKATSMGYLQVVLAMLYQTVLFAQPPGLESIAGAALIIVGTIAVSLRRAAAAARPARTDTSTAART